MRSGSTAPERSRRSQLASRVVPGRGRSSSPGGGGGPPKAVEGVWSPARRPLHRSPAASGSLPRTGEDCLFLSDVCWSFLSRNSGSIVAVTRAQSATSSGLSCRTRRDALGQQDVSNAVRRHSAGDLGGFGSSAPESVEAVRPLDRASRILRDPEAVRLG